MSARSRYAAVGLVVSLVVSLGIWARATDATQTTADEPHYLLTATALWDHHSLDYSAERANLRYWPYHSLVLLTQAEVGTNNSQVAPHDPLLPLLLAVPMGLGGWVAAKATMAVLAGLLAALMCWALERRIALRSRPAVIVALLAGCSPPLAVYGTQIYPELPGALLALAGYCAATSTPLRRPQVITAVSAVVALPWLNVKYALVAAALAIGLLARCAWRQRAAVAAALSAAAVGYAAAHQALYGGWTAYASGSHFADGEFTVVGNHPDYAGRSDRLVGLIVDHSFGLAAWQPLYLLAVPALGAALWRRRRPGDVVLVTMVLAGWLTATFAALTMHGWWWPGRQVVVVVPLVVLAIADSTRHWSAAGSRLAAAVGLLGPWSYATVLVGVYVGGHNVIVDVGRSPDPVSWLWRQTLPDLRADTARSAWLLSAWTVVAIAAIVPPARLHLRRAVRRETGSAVPQPRGGTS